MNFCHLLQIGELDAVLLLEQEIYSGFLFVLYIFHFKTVRFTLENLGNCNIKFFQHSEIIPVMYIVNLLYLYMRILFFHDCVMK